MRRAVQTRPKVLKVVIPIQYLLQAAAKVAQIIADTERIRDDEMDGVDLSRWRVALCGGGHRHDGD